jgi:hypothetical protein
MQNGKHKKRSLLAFDLSRAWANALREVWGQYYPDKTSPAALVRHCIQEFVACYLTEAQMKAQGLLPVYRKKPDPELLQSALNHNTSTRGGQKSG